MVPLVFSPYFFCFTTPAPSDIYTLSLHDALPICHPAKRRQPKPQVGANNAVQRSRGLRLDEQPDRKSTRLNSSHITISYAVFCLKKKNKPGKQGRHRRPTRDQALRQPHNRIPKPI